MTARPPWGDLGVEVPKQSDIAAALGAANLDWKVVKTPMFAVLDHKKIVIPDRAVLLRETDGASLSVVSPDWVPMQNGETLEAFRAFADGLKIEHIGSVKGGRVMWGLVNLGEQFRVANRPVASYALLSNSHEYGRTMDARYMAMMTDTMSTLVLPIEHGALRTTRRSQFGGRATVIDELRAKHAWLSAAAEEMQRKEWRADFFSEVFRNSAKSVMIASGAMRAAGGRTVWDAVRAVAFTVDHKLGYSADTRLNSAWYGVNRLTKERALALAATL